ncbi:hypothetical protein glysoja_000311 [Glycine soja]|nr:hypothetical protein glysoja_000311 [Glycine soja]
MKNNRASGILKLIAALRSMAKSKSLALKSKTNAIKARLVIFSLVMNKRYVMSTISDKFQSLLGHHHSHLKEVEDGNDSVEDKCTVVINDNAHLHEDFVSTSSLQASIGSSIVSTSERWSVIDLVKSSKEEAGQEFKMEDEIDHMADLFIRKFRRQIMLQKQDSLKRNEMQIQ